MEIFKDIKGYEGCYQISNLGNIKSLEKTWKSGKKLIRYKPDTILKPSKNRGGYLIVALNNNGFRKSYSVHRLVCYTFLHESNLLIDHINGIKDDNRIINLRYCTSRENQSFSNVKRNNETSKFTGVGYVKKTNLWRSRIFVNKKSIFLGTYKTEIEAINAYKQKLNNL
jgi:hypothetical protein